MITEQTTFTWKHLHEGSVVVPQQHPLLAAKTTEATKNRSSTPASAAVSTASASQPIARTAPARSANGTRASFAWQPPRPEHPERKPSPPAAAQQKTASGCIPPPFDLRVFLDDI